MNRWRVLRLAVLIACSWPCQREMAASSTPDGQQPVVAPNSDGRQILEASAQRHHPQSEEYLGEIIVTSQDGKERRKQWRSYRSGPAGASDRLIRFLSPTDIRGVAYLAQHRPGRMADEWLYLPSMKRERRIGVRDRDAAFVGTSFSYEDLDLLEFDPARYIASRQSDEGTGSSSVFVITLVPRTASAYVRKVLRLRQTDLALVDVEFFAAGNASPVKRLSLTDYMDVGGYRMAARIEMQDFRKHNRTLLLLHDVVVDRPQPSDRYTIQNLLREDDGRESERAPARGGASMVGPGSAKPVNGSGLSKSRLRALQSAVPEDRPRALASGTLTGYVEAKGFLFFGDESARADRAWRWMTGVARGTGHVGALRFQGSLRFESSSSPLVGPRAFDPADRLPSRSPISIRTASLTLPIKSTIDLEIGRFDVAWGDTDGYSPADAFLPRDLSDPLTEERLPLVGAHLRGELQGVRFEALAVPLTTSWRLPVLGARVFASPDGQVSLMERPWSVPRRGFGAVRMSSTVGDWDMGAWVRAGVRPVPVLDPRIGEQTSAGGILTVPLDRHFTNETGVGGSLSRVYDGWVVHGELGLLRSDDVGLAHAAIWSIGGSRVVRNGMFTATVAANAVAPPVSPLLIFDRALLPVVILAVHQYEPWGSWQAGWLGTFHTVGGVLTIETTKNLVEDLALTLGADLPHGSSLSPATAFSGGKRIRSAIRWSW